MLRTPYLDGEGRPAAHPSASLPGHSSRVGLPLPPQLPSRQVAASQPYENFHPSFPPTTPAAPALFGTPFGGGDLGGSYPLSLRESLRGDSEFVFPTEEDLRRSLDLSSLANGPSFPTSRGSTRRPPLPSMASLQMVPESDELARSGRLELSSRQGKRPSSEQSSRRGTPAGRRPGSSPAAGYEPASVGGLDRGPDDELERVGTPGLDTLVRRAEDRLRQLQLAEITPSSVDGTTLSGDLMGSLQANSAYLAVDPLTRSCAPPLPIAPPEAKPQGQRQIQPWPDEEQSAAALGSGAPNAQRPARGVEADDRVGVGLWVVWDWMMHSRSNLARTRSSPVQMARALLGEPLLRRGYCRTALTAASLRGVRRDAQRALSLQERLPLSMGSQSAPRSSYVDSTASRSSCMPPGQTPDRQTKQGKGEGRHSRPPAVRASVLGGTTGQP